MFYIVVCSITLLALILLIIVSFYNKFQFAIIKINEAEENCDIVLHKKYDLLKRTVPIIRKSLKNKNLLEEINSVSIENFNHFELNDILANFYTELFKIIDENEKLLKSKPLSNILNDLNENEEELIACITYYNDTVVEYNRLVISFPSNVIRLLFRYKKKDFYSHEKHEIFEILKEENTD